MRVNDVFPGWADGAGIMSALWATGEIPWEEPGTVPVLDTPYPPDLEYHGNHSGMKNVSPLVENLFARRGGYDYPGDEITWIANTIISMCGENWRKQWNTLLVQYNPVENYSMVEQMTNDRTVDQYGRTRTWTYNLQHTKTGTEQNAPNVTETRTDNLQHTKTGTEQDAPNTTETTTPNLTTTGENSVYGFNSADAVPSDAGTRRETGTSATARTGTDTRTYNTTDADTGTSATARTGTDTLTYNTTDADTGTQTDADGGSDTRTRNYTLTRSGNIGVTTSQQMIESERNLWVWNFFYNVVFPDIDRILTIQIY